MWGAAGGDRLYGSTAPVAWVAGVAGGSWGTWFFLLGCSAWRVMALGPGPTPPPEGLCGGLTFLISPGAAGGGGGANSPQPPSCVTHALRAGQVLERAPGVSV